MEQRLLLLLLLLGTISAFRLENSDSLLESPKREADPVQDLDGAEEQREELALNQEVRKTEVKVEASRYEDIFEDGKATESDTAALDKDLACPREEDTVSIQGNPGCKTCRYVLVKTPETFDRAQTTCKTCYRGNLVSIHSFNINYKVQCLARKINRSYVWIGGILKGWLFWKNFRWTDGSSWDFGYWAPGQPGNGGGHCVTLGTKGGHWRRASCESHFSFVCSY